MKCHLVHDCFNKIKFFHDFLMPCGNSTVHEQLTPGRYGVAKKISCAHSPFIISLVWAYFKSVLRSSCRYPVSPLEAARRPHQNAPETCQTLFRSCWECHHGVGRKGAQGRAGRVERRANVLHQSLQVGQGQHSPEER